MDETLKEAIKALCLEHGYELIALEVMEDHVHVFLITAIYGIPATMLDRLGMYQVKSSSDTLMDKK